MAAAAERHAAIVAVLHAAEAAVVVVLPDAEQAVVDHVSHQVSAAIAVVLAEACSVVAASETMVIFSELSVTINGLPKPIMVVKHPANSLAKPPFPPVVVTTFQPNVADCSAGGSCQASKACSIVVVAAVAVTSMVTAAR